MERLITRIRTKKGDLRIDYKALANLPQEYAVEVPTAWTYKSGAGYSQTIVVEGIKADDDPIVDVLLGDDIDENADALDAWLKVTRITTADGSITVHANFERPATAFTLLLKVV